MGVGVVEPVGSREFLQLETRAPVAVGPGDAIGAQHAGHPHHVDQIPARVAVAPLALVGVVEIAVERAARELVVEAQRVVAHAAGAGRRELGVDPRNELRLEQPLGIGPLRRDAVNQAGAGVRQVVFGQAAEDIEGLADLVQLRVGANPRELHRPIERGITPEGLVVVPVEARGGCHAAMLSARRYAVPRSSPARASGRCCARSHPANPPPPSPACRAPRTRRSPPCRVPGMPARARP